MKKIEPIIKIQRKIEYPKLTLKPIKSVYRDELELEFRTKGILITASIDGAGNTFLLPYEAIRGCIK